MASDSITDYPLHAAGIKGSGQYQDVVSPYSGETIARVEQADAAAVEAGLAQAADQTPRRRQDRAASAPAAPRQP